LQDKLALYAFTIIALVSFVAATAYTQTQIIFMIPSPTNNTYILPLIHCDQNLIKDNEINITVTTYRQSLATPFLQTLFPDATVQLNITSPSGITDTFFMANIGNGNYTHNYTFTNIGTYILTVDTNSSEESTVSRATIYVGKFPIYVTVLPGTEYVSNETGEVDIEVNDGNGNPITGGSATIKIWYPNKTLWVNGSAMEEHLYGIYFYNFTAPQETGEYLVYINFTSGPNNEQIMDKFHVAPWANKINEIQKFLNDTIFGNLYVEPNTITGSITQGSTEQTAISMINLGNTPINIYNITATNGITPSFSNGSVSVNKDLTLYLTFNTTELGNITGNLTVNSASKYNQTQLINVNLAVVSGGTPGPGGGGGYIFFGNGVTQNTQYFHYIDTTKKEIICDYVWNFIDKNKQFPSDSQSAIVVYTPIDILDLRQTIAKEENINVIYDELKQYVDYPQEECPRLERAAVATESLWPKVLLGGGIVIIIGILIASNIFQNKRSKPQTKQKTNGRVGYYQ
jgi:hypothetical protein